MKKKKKIEDNLNGPNLLKTKNELEIIIKFG